MSIARRSTSVVIPSIRLTLIGAAFSLGACSETSVSSTCASCIDASIGDGPSDSAVSTSPGDSIAASPADSSSTFDDAGSDASRDSDAPDAIPDVPPAPGAEPPGRPATSTSGGATKWFVVKHLHLGLIDRATGKASPNAWKQLGFDLDHRTTSAIDSETSFDSCKRVVGSPRTILADGELGRDNSFGAHFMQTLKALRSDVEDVVNGGIALGAPTLLLRLDDVGGDDDASAPGAIYRTGSLATSPRFDGTDLYPVDASSVVGDVLSEPVQRFPGGYMAGGLWVSDDPGSGAMDIPLSIVGAPMTLSLGSAVIVFRVATGSDGMLAGLVRDGDLLSAMTPVLETLDLCPGTATFDFLGEVATQTCDLVAGAPDSQDVTRTCDSISLGIGFDVAPAMAPTTVVPTPAPPRSSCP